MSFLAPLYILGALAVAAPVLFHLIRRTPRGEIPFSSLMFLSPSPPRITRRSRIEHWLLLVLRGLALILIALAFSRPFWRQPAQALDDAVAQRRIVVLVDASASMRRGALWPQAIAAVDDVAAEIRPFDEVAVYVFDDTLRPVATFDDLGQIDPQRRRAVIADRMADVEPTWVGTHLGQALLDAAALASDVRETTEEAGRAARTIVLVSDLQHGSRAEVLGDAPWPADVRLELKPLTDADVTNAALWRLADDAESHPGEVAAATGRTLRIRVANSADSTVEQFELAWTSATGPADPATSLPTVAYVPPGESRVVRVAPPPPALDQPRLVLNGDAHDFDNTLHFVATDRRELVVGYLGDDAPADREGLRYFLDVAVTSDPTRDVRVEPYEPQDEQADGDAPIPLVVATLPPSPAQAADLRQYVERGGTLLYVMTDAAAADGLAHLLAVDELPAAEAEVDDYAILGEIDFSHPVFAAMAGPRFNDFTQIRFWRHRRLDVSGVEDLRVVAQFDDGDPAIVEQRIGAGRLVAMSAGWHPADGQLARSWKFLLMLRALVDDNVAARDFRTEYLVNERRPLPDRRDLAEPLTVTRPDGTEVALAEDAEAFAAADAPGVYELNGATGPIPFAVNLDPAESDTAPLAPEALEQLGVRLAGRDFQQPDAEQLQQLRDVELESRQRIWQWMIAAALGVLILETVLAGRLSRRMESPLAVG